MDYVETMLLMLRVFIRSLSFSNKITEIRRDYLADFSQRPQVSTNVKLRRSSFYLLKFLQPLDVNFVPVEPSKPRQRYLLIVLASLHFEDWYLRNETWQTNFVLYVPIHFHQYRRVSFR